jgi:hypothetical protein
MIMPTVHNRPQAQRRVRVIDIDAEFRKAFGPTTACNEPVSEKPLTMEILREVMRSMPPLPPDIRLSEHVPALGLLRPSASPLTDDMRQMVEDMGEQLGLTAWNLKTDLGDVIFINPVNLKEGK